VPAAASAVDACTLPVFRVALLDRRWRPEPYEFTLFHDGPLPEREKEILRGFNDYLDKNEGHVNVVLQVVDFAKKPDNPLLELSRQRGTVRLPYLVVRYPDAAGIDANLWAGPLRDAPLRGLVDSPARRELGKRLLAGESAVWVFLDGGDRAADDAAF